jgi:hypothetical protein
MEQEHVSYGVLAEEAFRNPNAPTALKDNRRSEIETRNIARIKRL